MRTITLPSASKTSHVVFLGLFTLCLLFWGNSVVIIAKASLAKYLIAHAWEKTLSDHNTHKPWPWADTWPVGKLHFPKHDKTFYVLAGAHGSSLAFGPGLVDGTALPEEEGTTVIGGHRDTHFAFLQHVDNDHTFSLQDKDGHWQTYRLAQNYVMDSRQGPWYIDEQKNEVHLITCYPFDAITPGGAMRWVGIGTPVLTSELISRDKQPVDSLTATSLRF